MDQQENKSTAKTSFEVPKVETPKVEGKKEVKPEVKTEPKSEAKKEAKETKLVPNEPKVKTKIPIWGIVLMVLLGISLIAAIIGIFRYRKSAKNALAKLDKIKGDFK